MTLEELRWEQLPRYPERPFVRHRAEAAQPLTLARVSPMPDRPATVSIIIPTLDARREGYLPRLLAQIDAQTYKDWELFLVVGDQRQGRAINAAAALAKGQFLLTLDDDTELASPGALERAKAAMDSDPTIGMAGGLNVIPRDAPRFVARVMREIPRRSTPRVAHVTDSDLAEHPFLLMRRDAFFKVGGENELLPRGLDPYLREAFRNEGYRVVVVPGAEYSHLPPPTFPKLIRQFWRNGRAAAFVNRHYPQWAIETPSVHGPFRPSISVPRRVLRFPIRLLSALFQGKPIWFACEFVYACGFAWEWCFPATQTR